MKNDDSITVLLFIRTLARMRYLFRDLHLYLQSMSGVHCIHVDISPSEHSSSSEISKNYADYGVTINMELDSELTKMGPEGQHSMGISVLVRRSNGQWIAEGEIGWISNEIGWDRFYDKEIKADNINIFFEELPKFTSTMVTEYKTCLINHIGNKNIKQ